MRLLVERIILLVILSAAVGFAIGSIWVDSPERKLRNKIDSFVRKDFFDPEAARLRFVISAPIDSGARMACGRANGKNRFGGYVGEEDFRVWIDPDGTLRHHYDILASEDDLFLFRSCMREFLGQTE